MIKTNKDVTEERNNLIQKVCQLEKNLDEKNSQVISLQAENFDMGTDVKRLKDRVRQLEREKHLLKKKQKVIQ